jgi:hypothetical protein
VKAFVNMARKLVSNPATKSELTNATLCFSFFVCILRWHPADYGRLVTRLHYADYTSVRQLHEPEVRFGQPPHVLLEGGIV